MEFHQKFRRGAREGVQAVDVLRHYEAQFAGLLQSNDRSMSFVRLRVRGKRPSLPACSPNVRSAPLPRS